MTPSRHSGTHAGELAALLAQAAAEVSARPPPRGMATRIVAIDGLGGAGKSTFAGHLSRALGGAKIVHTDDFASWDNPIDWWPELIENVLEPLARNEAVRFKRSQWGAGRHPEWVELRPAPAEFVIPEGVTASREAFTPYLTYTIWIDAPTELRLERGLERDGQASRAQWELWLAGEERYRARERPDQRADLIVPGGRNLWT